MNKTTKGTQGRIPKTKTLILGILEGDDKVYAVPFADAYAKSLIPIIESKVKKVLAYISMNGKVIVNCPRTSTINSYDI